MNKMESFRQFVAGQFDQLDLKQSPKELYEPIQYILSLGGKRIRPVLMMLSHELFDGNPTSISGPALAVEMFHNFTLIHDDIMDNAGLRRGKPTVHEKWDRNIAILSGDALCILSYDYLIRTEPTTLLPELVRRFNKTSIEICEGQQMDLNFETAGDVTLSQYKEMIRLKTAVLLGFSLWTGAYLAGASQNEQELCYRIGENMGLAFQLKDDYLDAFGSTAQTGKEQGGDIRSGKKTYLQIEAKRLGFSPAFSGNADSSLEVPAVIKKYRELGLDHELQQEVEQYAAQAIQGLHDLKKSHENLNLLEKLIEQLSNRDH